jgi:hypothetical protein
MDQLRRHIDAGPLSRYALSKKIGLDQGTLSKFMAGKCGLSVTTIDRIGDTLNLNLTKGR